MEWPSLGGEIIPVKHHKVEGMEPNYGLLVAEINKRFDGCLDSLKKERPDIDPLLLDHISTLRRETNESFCRAFTTMLICGPGLKIKDY